MTRLFITATGTEIGKTYFTCKLISQLNALGKTVAALKPIISGFEAEDPTNDIALICAALGMHYTKESIEALSCYRFAAPLSPDMAAEMENTEIDFNTLLTFLNKERPEEVILIEGAGGVIVPLNKEKTSLDLMQELNAPVIVLTGNYLGALSHTLTACSTLSSRGITIKAVVISAYDLAGVDAEKMKTTLGRFIAVPIYILEKDGNPSAFLSELM